MSADSFETVVVGGGQAGLAAAYHLARQGRDFVVLEAAERLGHSWRSRWDSLRLFTPASYSHLPGMKCGAADGRYQSKDELADYLETYAMSFGLPVRLGSRVESLTRFGDRYVLTVAARPVEAAQVVLATGAFTAPYVPEFADKLDPSVDQLHSVDYRNPGRLKPGDVMVVGAGNSGAEIALELAASHRVWLAGRDTGHVPFPMGAAAYRVMGRLSVHAWPGRGIAASGTGRGHPLISVGPDDLRRAEVRRVPRVVGVEEGRPLLADGRLQDVRTVVWCTGFVPDYSWIDLPFIAPDRVPLHRDGSVRGEPGLHLLGLPFQSTVTSHLVGGVGADAARLVRRLPRRAGR
ncbi:putative oxidoreductase CzcO [Streptomyces sp. enrichment culture]|uniref:flavin-containing monooxygenase n=1 Tax=Streptomyces sp. enrichment culture TaxID=1795815 RepID=UPI003F54AC5B